MKSKFIYTTMLAIMLACVAVILPGCSNDGEGEVAEVLQDTYTPDNSGLAGYYIRCITIDAQGRKWIGTDQGVSMFDGTNGANYTKANGLVNNNVYCIAIDAQGNKWIGTEAGVSVFNGTNGTNYTIANGLVDNNVQRIAIDAQNNKGMISINMELFMFDGTEGTTISGGDGAYCIAFDTQGNRGTGNLGRGVTVYDYSNSSKNYRTADGLIGNNVTCITIDAQGNKGIGTNVGISMFDGTNGTSYTTENSGLKGNSISCITIDAQGNKGIGTEGNGVCMFDGTNGTNPAIDGKTNDYISCITIDANGNKGVGSGNGNGIGIIKAQ